LDCLTFADGLKDTQHESEETAWRKDALDTLVRGALVSTGQYEERVLFEKYFPAPELTEGMAADDSELDMDYSGVDFGTPTESEMQILQRMLADTTVTISDLDGPEQPEDPLPALPAPREIALADIEQDREWV
jgi:hypothetical protein